MNLKLLVAVAAFWSKAWKEAWFRLLCLLALVAAAGWGTYLKFEDEHQHRVVAELALAHQKELVAGTEARLAHESSVKDSLTGLMQAERLLHGKLLAGLRLALARRDTLVMHDTLPTISLADSASRVAHFRDSTFAGTIAGTITAPPYPAALGLSYVLTRPAFSPEIGFVKVGDSVVAVVRWQGEHAEIAAPYFDLPQKPLPLVGYFVETSWTLVGELEVRGGALVRVGRHLRLQMAAENQLLTHPSVNFGFRYEW
jgi:hypothetical protein